MQVSSNAMPTVFSACTLFLIILGICTFIMQLKVHHESLLLICYIYISKSNENALHKLNLPTYMLLYLLSSVHAFE